MTTVIYKVELAEKLEEQGVSLPRKCRILKVDEQQGKIVLWYTCDPNEQWDVMTVIIKLVETGQYFNDDVNHYYVGTVQLNHGEYVLHVLMKP